MSEDHGRFIWYELMTPDLEAAKRFYGAVVGWTAQTMPMGNSDQDHPEGHAYTILEADGAGIGGAIPLSDEHKAQGVPPELDRLHLRRRLRRGGSEDRGARRRRHAPAE